MHLYERTYQTVMGAGMKLLPSYKQTLLKGPGSLGKIPRLLQEHDLHRPLIVTGPRVSQTDFFQRLVSALEQAGEDNAAYDLKPAVFRDVEPDPTTDLVKRVCSAYQESDADCFIAVGGGSNMDAAKAAAASLARPGKSLVKLGGVMKVRRKTPFMIAVPTTAGTGSECTVAAVVTDSQTHHKFAINDPCLCPDAAVLDADLTENLPSSVVAATGMDALTHAVEAWLNRPYHKRHTAQQCISAVHDILLYLPFVYEEAKAREEARAGASSDCESGEAAARKAGTDTARKAGTAAARKAGTAAARQSGSAAARQKMLEASYKAGQAFTTACVGNVHAVAHTLGGMYHIPHGLANAVLLPVILEDYGRRTEKALAKLAREAGLERMAKVEGKPGVAFIRHIRQMNRSMDIPEGFSQIRAEDLDQLAEWAVAEANPFYPVPVIYDKADVKRILKKISE